MSTWKSGGNFDAFHSLDAEKQKRIINAALAEFGEKGFKGASTNVIAGKAHIGKGMLFYYFGSKDELFDFLYQYATAFIRTEYIQQFQADTGDFLKRYMALSCYKQSMLKQFPEIIRFLEMLYTEEISFYAERYAEDVEDIRKKLYEKLYGDIDYSRFRKDVDGKTAVKYLKWLMDGYEADLTARYKKGEFNMEDKKSLDAEWSKYFTFIDDLRKVFYQKEDTSNENH